MRRVLPAVAVALVLLGACGGTDRPEGVVERWLISLNQGKAGEPDRYAPASLSERILPHWQTRDPGDLDVIEVGKGRTVRHAFGISALVPYRVKRSTGTELNGDAVVERVRGRWQIAAIRAREAGLEVPSEGGERIGSASAATWGIAIGISAALMLLVAALMHLTPKPMALPSRKQ